MDPHDDPARDRARRDRRGALAGLEDLERLGAGRRAPAPPPPSQVAPPMRPDQAYRDQAYRDQAHWDQAAARGAAPLTPTGVPVPRRTRGQVRRTGPLVALLLPAIAGVAAVLMLRDSTSTATGIGGFVLSLVAAPLLPVFGEPMRAGSGGVLGAAAASAVLWFVLGGIAAHRATRRPTGGWGAFWAEYLWLCLCAWMGAALAVVAANLVLGRVLL
jgi:hypothetical protein